MTPNPLRARYLPEPIPLMQTLNRPGINRPRRNQRKLDTMNTDTLRNKLYGLTFKNADTLAKKLKGGAVGFNPFLRFARTNGRPMVHQYADWIIETFSADAIAANVDGYMERSRKAREFVAGRPGAVRRGIPVPTGDDDTGSEPDETADTAEPEPVAEETPEPVYQPGTMEAAIAAIVRDMLARHTGNVSPAQVIDIVKPVIDAAIERAKLPRTVNITVTRPEGNGTVTANLGRQHKTFARLLARCGLRLNVWLAGPAGSGKTTAAVKVAEALGLAFHFTGSIDTEYKLLGFTDAQGRTVRTAFREAWEHGGVFLFDECDGSAASALLALNAALANGSCAFPDGVIPKHPDCIIIAAANTWGMGATFEYVGRAKLDAASMDRFVRMAWDYDDELVRDTCGNPAWADKVIRFRRNAASIKGHIISPRAAYNGARMLAAGIPEAEVIEEVITPGLTADQRRIVLN